MSDEIVEPPASASTPEQQQEARRIGWQPPEKFKGTQEDFVDADEYIRRAETVLPIIKEQNRRLEGTVNDLRSRLESAVGESAQLAKRLEDIDIENSTRLAREVKKAREEVKAELAEALEAGNHSRAAELTVQAAQLEQVVEPEEKKAEPKAAQPQLTQEQQRAINEFNAWSDENDFAKWSPRERAEFRLIGEELRREGSSLIGRAFAEAIMSDMKREAKVEPASKVESGRSSGGARGGKKTGYEALTAEERAVCDSDSRNFVGKGKRFEKVEDYRAHWAKVYQEQA